VTVDTGDMMLRLLVALLCGQAVGWFYARSSPLLSYSQTFVQSLALLTMVVTVVMMVVGESLARAFGLAAALAVVRFRTPVKDARDAVYLFFGVAIGMAAGAGAFGLATLATALIGFAAWWLDFTAFGTRVAAEGILRFRMEGGNEHRAAVADVLGRHCRSFSLTAARQAGSAGPEELVYDVDLRAAHAAEALVRDLTGLGAVSSVSLLPLARVGEG
jgi:hypothetical protein